MTGWRESGARRPGFWPEKVGAQGVPGPHSVVSGSRVPAASGWPQRHPIWFTFHKSGLCFLLRFVKHPLSLVPSILHPAAEVTFQGQLNGNRLRLSWRTEWSPSPVALLCKLLVGKGWGPGLFP